MYKENLIKKYSRLYVKTPTDDDKKKQEKIMKDYLAKTGHVNIMESNNKVGITF